MDDLREDLLDLTAAELDAEPAEEEKEEVKVFSFRMTDTTKNAISQICKDTGLTSAKAFDQLVQLYKLDEAKKQIPSRETEIENFEALLQSINTAFVHSLELNMNAEMRIRQTVEQELQTKDQTIADYQNSITEKNEKIKKLKEKADQADALQSEVTDLKKNAENFEKQIADKDSIVVMLTEKLSVAEEKVKTSEEKTKKYDEIVSRATLAEDKVKRLEEEKEHASALAEEQKKAAVSAAVQQAKEDFQKEKDALQREILDAEKAAHKKEQELQNAIIDLERQLGDLKLDKEKLQNESATKIEKLSRTYNELQTEFNSYKKAHPSAQKPE
ncbi:MAG: hypothetical protein IIV02_04455 [Peptococcaceae bacterium]|nr:hypothetical protein [Peptococcaceae bacterium]